MRGENILGVSVGNDIGTDDCGTTIGADVGKMIGADDKMTIGADEGGTDTDVTGPDVGKRKDEVGPTVL